MPATLTGNLKNSLIDRFTMPVNPDWKICESYEDGSVVDGQRFLARVVGNFFLVNGKSLNNRFYSKNLWEKCIANCNERFAHGGLFGTIGHDQPLDENAVRNGDVSHTVTKLWITEDGLGMGELLVLNTKSGTQLNACLRAGMPLPVSSRAYGKVSGQLPDGTDVIDEDSFYLETFDFVLNPGVDSAYPKVVENVNEEVTDMNKEVLEQLVEDKTQLQGQLTEALTENKTLREQSELLAKYKKLVEFYQSSVGKVDEVKNLAEGLRKFLQMERFKGLASAKDYLDRPQGDVQKKLNVSVMAEALMKMADEVVSAGIPEEIASTLEAYKKLGTVEQITAAAALLEEYGPLGKPAEVKERVEKAEKLEKSLKEARRNAAAKKIAEKLNVNEKVVVELLKKMKVSEVIENLKALRESDATEKQFKKVNDTPSKEGKSAQSEAKSSPVGDWASRYMKQVNERADRLITESAIRSEAIKRNGGF